MHNQILAKESENLAADYLSKHGYKILERNYRSVFGEIDIIAKDKKTICFIEVKSRSSQEFGLPTEAIHLTKRKHMVNSARSYLKDFNMSDISARFDVISIIDGKLDLIKNAFDLNDI
jgi:putative endonuclease